MTKLTKTVIEQAEVKEKPYFIFDTQVLGFCVRVSSTGKRLYKIEVDIYKRLAASSTIILGSRSNVLAVIKSS